MILGRIDTIPVAFPKKVSVTWLECYIVAVVLDPADALLAWLQRRMVELPDMKDSIIC